jgi:hypothetical protein
MIAIAKVMIASNLARVLLISKLITFLCEHFVDLVVDDECATAATMYGCVNSKVPNITKKMIEIGAGSNVTVINQFVCVNTGFNLYILL